MQKTKISWTDASWQPVVGCSKVSLGCRFCYAERMACRLANMGQDKYCRVVTAIGDGNKWNTEVYCDESALDKITPRQKPKMIFVCSMGDLFHKDVPFEFIDKVYGTMILSQAQMTRKSQDNYHVYQLLTKRAERMLEYYNSRPWSRITKYLKEKYDWNWGAGRNWYPENIWLGVSCENQEWWEKRKQAFFDTPAAIHFVSFEPLLGEIILSDEDLKQLDQVIIGAESNGAWPGRECKLEWIKNIVNQCESANVPVFVKQIHWTDGYNKTWLIKDKRHFPEGYPQQYPKEIERCMIKNK